MTEENKDKKENEKMMDADSSSREEPAKPQAQEPETAAEPEKTTGEADAEGTSDGETELPEESAVPDENPEETAAAEAETDDSEISAEAEEAIRKALLYSVVKADASEAGAIEEKRTKKRLPKAVGVTLIIVGILLGLLAIGYGVFHILYMKLDHRTDDADAQNAAIERWKNAGMGDTILGEDDEEPDPDAVPEDEGPMIPVDEYLTVPMEEGPDSAALTARAEELAQEAAARQQEADEIRAQAEAMAARAEERRLYEEEQARLEEERIQNEIRAAMEENGGTPITDSKVVNVLLIGTDTRDADYLYSRADAMILVSVNSETKEIILTSFMRDTYVYMKRADTYNRLNAANVIGGPTYLCSVISDTFGVRVDKYASVNFFTFIDVLDALGGVDIEVKEEEISNLNDNLVHQNYVRGFEDEMDFVEHGTADKVLHLNGNQALAYARIRYVGGDAGRTERQRKVLSLLIDKVRGMSLAELYELTDVILPLVRTNLTELDCLTVLLNSAEYMDYTIKSIRIPYDGAYKFSQIDGKSVVEIKDLAKCRSYLKREIYG